VIGTLYIAKTLNKSIRPVIF